MKDNLVQLSDIISNLNRQPEVLPPTPSSSPVPSPAKRMVIRSLPILSYDYCLN